MSSQSPWVVADIRRVVVANEDECPANAVPEINGGSRDIMKGHGGQYSFLVPVKRQLSAVNGTWAPITSIAVDITSSSRGDGYTDLAKGAGGDYIYLDTHTDGSNPYKISDIAILRSSDSKTLGDVASVGYQGMTEDVCRGRGGDYVYIVWKTITA